MDKELTGVHGGMAVNHFSFENNIHERANLPDSRDVGDIFFPVLRSMLELCTKTFLFSEDIVSLELSLLVRRYT